MGQITVDWLPWPVEPGRGVRRRSARSSRREAPPPSLLVLGAGVTTEVAARRGGFQEASVLDLRNASIEALQAGRTETPSPVALVTPSWAHVSGLLAPLRLLGSTHELQVLFTTPEQAPDRSGLSRLAGLRALDWTAESEDGLPALRLLLAVPGGVHDVVKALVRVVRGPLHLPLRVALDGRGPEPHAVGATLVRYLGIDDLVVTPTMRIAGADLALVEVEHRDELGPAGTRGEFELPALGVAGPHTRLAATGSARPFDPALGLPPVDTSSVNPGGFLRETGDVTGRLIVSGDSAVGITDDGGAVTVIGEGDVVAAAQVAEVRRFRVVDVDLPVPADPWTHARIVAQLAAAGVPLVAWALPSVVQELLGASLVERLRQTTAQRLAGPLVREAVSVGLRRAAIADHSPGCRARRLAELAGLYVPPLPTVSVVLVTRRPGFLADAVAQIVRQTWGSLEIVIGLHGDDFPAALVDEVTRNVTCEVTVVRAPADVPYGEVLNRTTEHCRGTWITKWDDDDLYGRDHVSDLMMAADYSGATVVGKRAEYVWLEDLGILVRSDVHGSELLSPWVAGGTLLIARKSLDDIGGWRPVQRGVDYALTRQVIEEGGTVWRTHGLGYILRRHSDRHTWDPGMGYFLRQPSRQWRFTDVLRRTVLDTMLDEPVVEAS